MRGTRLAAVLCGLAVVLGAALARADDREKMVGTWKVVSGTEDGKPFPAAQVQGSTVDVSSVTSRSRLPTPSSRRSIIATEPTTSVSASTCTVSKNGNNHCERAIATAYGWLSIACMRPMAVITAARAVRPAAAPAV